MWKGGFVSSLVNLALGRLPAYTRKARHIGLLWQYNSFGKSTNIIQAEAARLRGDIVVRARPYIYTIDIGNICNLRCPLCPTGYGGLERPQGLMRLPEFRKVLEKIKPYALEVVLHNWGEPFLNPDFLDIVRATKAARLGTAASTNLNLVHRGRGYLHEVVDSGLDHLVASIDGTTQEVYETYRRNGNLDHALANLRELVNYKRSQGRATPIIEWQFLVMKHNEHQIDEARRLADEIGVDRLRFTGAGMPFDDLANTKLAAQWLPENPEYRGYDPAIINDRGYLYDEKCFYLYRAMTVNPNGEVAPCCAIHHSNWDFGNLLHSPLDDVWNNEHYRASRALFSGKPYESAVKTACHSCPLYKYSPNHTRP